MGCLCGSNPPRGARARRAQGAPRVKPPPQVMICDLYEDPNPTQAAAAAAPGVRVLAADPLAGLEIELHEVQIIDFRRVGAPPAAGARREVWNRMTADLRGGVGGVPWRDLQSPDLRVRRLAALEFIIGQGSNTISPMSFAHPKRHPIFSPPNGTWVGTTDTIGRFYSRVEVITAALSAAEWDAGAVAEDLEVYDAVYRVLSAGENTGRVVPIDVLRDVDGLRIHEPEVFFVAGGGALSYFQLTRQLPIPRVLSARYDVDDDLARGMNPLGVELLIDTIHHFTHGAPQSENPKEQFRQLIKSPLDRALQRAASTPADQQWIEAIAGLAGMANRLDDDALAYLSDYAAGALALAPAGFTWRTFIRDVAGGRDRLARDWSPHGFANGEDFGYGSLDFPLNNGWVIAEDRTLGDRGLSGSDGIRTLVGEWILAQQ